MSKIIFVSCVLHNFCQLMDEASPRERPNIHVDPHVDLIRQRHLRVEGHGVALAGVALINALFADFHQIEK